jgi:hypothetical protein
VRRAFTAVEAAAGEGSPNSLARAEARRGESPTSRARALRGQSSERLQALKDTAPQQYARMATEGADDMDRIMDLSGSMGDTSSSPRVKERLRETISEPSPVQTEWFTASNERLSEAKRAVRAPIEATGPPQSMEQYLHGMKEGPAREKAFQRLTDDITDRAGERGVSVSAGTKEWDEIAAEVLSEQTPPVKRTSLADTQGLGGFANRIDTIIDANLREMDKASTNFERFLIERDTKKQLHHVSKQMSLVQAPQDPVFHAQLRQIVDDASDHLRTGLKDQSLFGNAAQIEQDINASWHEKILPGIGIAQDDLARKVGANFHTGKMEVEFDPSKQRSFYQADSVGRTIPQRKLTSVLEGAEEMAAAHERHGTWPKEQIAELRERVVRIRASLALADELQLAKALPVEQVAAKVKGHGLGDALEAIVSHVIPGFGTALNWARRLSGMDAAARTATKQVARNLAGVGVNAAERALGKAAGSTERGARALATGAAGAASATGAMTALARFTGDYSGPEESWEAKRKILDAEQVTPDVLYDVLGSTLGDLPKVNPELFQQIAARTAQKIRYLREHMPPGITVSLLYPDGTPPPRSALRDWATQWNTVMNPESVLQDIDQGTATPLQMKTLKESDPDLYEQLRSDCIEQVGTHFANVPTATKLQLDLLFDADGLAGPMFSSKAADMIGESMQAQKERGQNAPMPAPTPGETKGSAGPSGLEAIKSSVTNRAGI